jgi:hypothetical protein
MAKITTGTPDGDIKITPNGTGKTVVGTGAADATVQSSGDYNLVLQTGNATTGSITITDGANGNIAITPNGTGEVDITKVDIDGGTIDGVTIGGSSAGAVTTTSLVATTADIDGGTIDGVTIGGSSAGAGTFTTATATTVDSTNLEVTNIKAKDGTSAGSIADSTGVVTLASSVLTTAAINGGTIDGTTIGGTTPAAGTFTTFTSTGNVLAGKTSADSGATAGLEFDASIDKLYVTRSSGSTSSFNRLSTDGEIVGFAKDGTTVGRIGSANGGLDINGQSGYLGINTDQTVGGIFFYGTDYTGAPRIQPKDHNAVDLGNGSFSWNDGYIYNGVTTGSDGRQKQDIEELSEAEQRVALACKGLLRKFRWKDMVAKKGNDARIHFGIIAQDLKAAFESEGLDAGRYGMFIHSEWWESEETYTDDNGVEQRRTDTFDTEEEAPEGAVKKDRMGIRYSELLAFIIAAI